MQDIGAQRKCFANTGSTTNVYINTMVMSNSSSKNNHILPDPHEVPGERGSAKMTKQLQSKFKGVFTGIEYFEGTFSLWVNSNSKPCKAPPGMWHMHCRNH